MRFSPLNPELFVTENGEVLAHGVRQLAQSINRGYALVYTYRNGNRAVHRVHRLVASAYCDGYSPGLVVNHKDGNKLNNHCSNLEWTTDSENSMHARRVGLYDNAGNRKLTPAGVIEIRYRLLAGEMGTVLAKEYGVSSDAIYDIKHGRKWKRLLDGRLADDVNK